MHAAKLAGLDKIPTIIREMTDDEAVIVMVDSNIQRENLQKRKNVLMFVLQVVPTYLLRVRTRPEAYPLCYFR